MIGLLAVQNFILINVIFNSAYFSVIFYHIIMLNTENLNNCNVMIRCRYLNQRISGDWRVDYLFLTGEDSGFR